MAQADGVVANGTGSAVRSDINNQYAALWSNHSGSTEPSSGKVAYQFWADTNTNILKIRNSANNAWINLFTLAGGIDVDAASNFNEDVTFTGANYNLKWDKSANHLYFADNAKAVFGNLPDLSIFHDGTNSYLKNTTGALRVQGDLVQITDVAGGGGGDSMASFVSGGAANLYYDNVKKFETTSYGFVSSGYASIGNGTWSVVTGNNSKSAWGNDQDLQIFHNGTDSKLTNATGDLYIQNADSNSNQIYIRGKGGTNGIIVNGEGSIQLYNDNSEKLNTSSSGVTVHGTVNETSDIALKTNIKPIDNVLNKIQQITGYQYQFKDTGHNSMGVTAQDVEKVFPELVHGEEGEKTLQYSGLIGALVESVKELSAKVAALEAK